MDRDFDLVVVGSGSSGTSAATAVRERGWSVAVVDERPFGGTCALRGCDPKKVLVAAASAVDEAQRYADLGILERAPGLNWGSLLRFKKTFTDPVPEERESAYKDAGIASIHGTAKFVDFQTLDVNGDRLRARRILIAAGAATQHVAKGDDCLLTSESFLELGKMPASLIFVGGGYIAFEFAHVAARAGARVTVLHSGARPLGGFDPDVVQRLEDLTRRIGINLQLETRVESVERTADGVLVRASRRGEACEFRAESGVLAAGRAADLDRLDLHAGNVERTKKGVAVSEYLQSVSNPNVYAAGDAADGGGLPLTPVASYEGEIVAANLVDGNVRRADFRSLVTMVYTIPPLGTVGLTEAQARERDIDCEVRSGDMTDWYTTRHVAGRAAFYKTVLERESGKLLGATVFGPDAEQQLNLLALALQGYIRPDVLVRTLFAYPTGASDLGYLLGTSG